MGRLARHLDAVLCGVIGVVTLVLLRATSTSIGFVRDEGYYFKAAESYVGWYRALVSGMRWAEASAPGHIDRFFSYNHEHPALVKTAQGLAWWLWHEVLGIGMNSEAFRLPGPLFSVLAAVCTFLLGRRMHGRAVGLLAAASWVLLPRNFFHEHLACFDVPVTAMTLMVVTLYVHADTSWKRAAWVGVAWGLALATKHNALFIPPLLLIHWAATEGPSLSRVGTWVRLPGVPLALVAMAVIGPLVFLGHWPWIWHDTARRIGEYYGYHFFQHEHYPITYWGQLLRQPPFPYGFAFGMTLVTVPLTVLMPALVGLGFAIKDGFFTRAAPGTDAATAKSHAWILGLFTIFPMFVISLPSTPIFGGTKHWMPATPFYCLLAARGVHELVTRARDGLAPGRAWVPAVVMPLFLLTSVLGIARSHPHGQGYYNELIGGARGAATTGFQRHYWGEATRPMFAVLNEQAPPGARVFFNRTNYDSWRMYLRDRVLRQDIGYAQSAADSRVSFPFHQWEHEHELYNTWNAYGSRRPVAGEYAEGGVPLVTMYAR